MKLRSKTRFYLPASSPRVYLLAGILMAASGAWSYFRARPGHPVGDHVYGLFLIIGGAYLIIDALIQARRNRRND